MSLNNRSINGLIVIAVIGLMGYGLYSQYVDGLQPCPLCMTQRIFYCLTGALALVALLHNPLGWGARLYGGLIALSSTLGVAAAGRQVWLQHLPPDQVPACGPSLEYMLETFPFAEALKMLVLGDGNCALIDWVFLGLSMAEWSLLWLLVLTLAGLLLLVRRPT